MVITIGTVMVLLMFDDGETPTGRDLKKKVRLLGWRSNQRVPLNNRGWITSLTRGRWQVKRLETELLALAWGGWGRKTIVLNNLSSGWNFSTNFLNHSSSAEKKALNRLFNPHEILWSTLVMLDDSNQMMVFLLVVLEGEGSIAATWWIAKRRHQNTKYEGKKRKRPAQVVVNARES